MPTACMEMFKSDALGGIKELWKSAHHADTFVMSMYRFATVPPPSA